MNFKNEAGLRIESLEQRLALSSISLVADINGDTFSSESTALVKVGEKYLFRAVDASDSSKLFEFDPSTEESQVIHDLNASPGIHDCDLVTVGVKAFSFSFEDVPGQFDTKLLKLWVSDGIAKGTNAIMDVGRFNIRTPSYTNLLLDAVGDVVYFQTSDSGYGLRRSDGTTDTGNVTYDRQASISPNSHIDLRGGSVQANFNGIAKFGSILFDGGGSTINGLETKIQAELLTINSGSINIPVTGDTPIIKQTSEDAGVQIDANYRDVIESF